MIDKPKTARIPGDRTWKQLREGGPMTKHLNKLDEAGNPLILAGSDLHVFRAQEALNLYSHCAKSDAEAVAMLLHDVGCFLLEVEK